MNEHTVSVECPICDNPSLQQVRVRVFPLHKANSDMPCTVVEQSTGSALTLRESDMVHQRPAKGGMPAVTITYVCDYCVLAPGATIDMHICQENGESMAIWEYPAEAGENTEFL